ncbi:MAG: tetratricopeptide repeat protein [Pseudomonadota bacterium]
MAVSPLKLFIHRFVEPNAERMQGSGAVRMDARLRECYEAFMRILALILILTATPTVAQVSITTIGATDARQCFKNAASEYSSDTDPCDEAIRDSGTQRSDLAKTYVNRGIIHNRTGALQSAIEDFDNALLINMDLAEAYLNRGNAWFLAGRLDDALADYQQAIEMDVSQPWAAWYNVGLAHDAQKKPEQARDAYEKSVALNPEFSPAKEKLANR